MGKPPRNSAHDFPHEIDQYIGYLCFAHYFAGQNETGYRQERKDIDAGKHDLWHHYQHFRPMQEKDVRESAEADGERNIDAGKDKDKQQYQNRERQYHSNTFFALIFAYIECSIPKIMQKLPTGTAATGKAWEIWIATPFCPLTNQQNLKP